MEVIKHNCKKDMSSTEIHDFIKTLVGELPSYSTVKKRAAEFRRGRESVEVYERSGLPQAATTDERRKLSACSESDIDRRRSLCDIAKQIG